MAVAGSQLGDMDLDPAAIRVSLAGSLAGLRYPPICPNCEAPATVPVAVTKVFSWNHNDYGDSSGSGWKYRIAQAEPLFCTSCAARHYTQEQPVTTLDKLKTVLMTELALPGIGTLAFGLFLLKETGAKIVRDPAGQWLLLTIVVVLLSIGALCLRSAWLSNDHRRIPRQTAISRAFDFGDDGSNAFTTQLRTYAFRSAAYADAFGALNADRSAVARGPQQRVSENKRTFVVAAIVIAIATIGWWLTPG